MQSDSKAKSVNNDACRNKTCARMHVLVHACENVGQSLCNAHHGAAVVVNITVPAYVDI